MAVVLIRGEADNAMLALSGPECRAAYQLGERRNNGNETSGETLGRILLEEAAKPDEPDPSTRPSPTTSNHAAIAAASVVAEFAERFHVGRWLIEDAVPLREAAKFLMKYLLRIEYLDRKTPLVLKEVAGIAKRRLRERYPLCCVAPKPDGVFAWYEPILRGGELWSREERASGADEDEAWLSAAIWLDGAGG